MKAVTAPLRWLVIAPLVAGCLLTASARATAGDFSQAAAVAHARYVADLKDLAKWCQSKGLTEEAKKTLRLIGPSDPYKLYVPALSDEVGPPKPLADASETVVEWHARLDKLRRDHSAWLFSTARRAVRSGQAGLAFDLAMSALGVDPNYEPARHLFGYQKYSDRWRTVYEIKKLRTGNVWSERFGWLPEAHLRRYEEGQRFWNGRWISAEEDARRHHNIRAGWVVETEHYKIRTNHSIEAGVALGVKLERLYRLWQQLFVRYYASQADVVALFDGRIKLSPAQRRHKIVYFRDREDYNRALRARMPNIDKSIGAYVEQTGRAYFFPDEKDGERTLYHEATHQLFHESRPVVPGVGRAVNFWIVEGIALFMESLRQEDGYYVLGGFDDDRLHAAKYRLMRDNFYVPLDKFVDYGMDRMQKDPRIGTLYSQAAGLTHFLVFFEGGRYRDALVSYLVAVYTGRNNRDTLRRLTGAASYGTLDKQYRKFIEEGI